jgi:hypothetical protein
MFSKTDLYLPKYILICYNEKAELLTLRNTQRNTLWEINAGYAFEVCLPILFVSLFSLSSYVTVVTQIG